MTHQITHSYQDGVLYFTAAKGLNTPESLPEWDQLHIISHEHEAKRILIEFKACGRISMTHCFDLIERFPFLCQRLTCKIALFEQHMCEEARDLLKFVETAATDRGAHIKLFGDLEEAKLWLGK
ncbi:MAG: hypothetical protein ISR85_00295 [Kiritimatiellales bacterium]|nr:hypothetical protein [Kiritimatiellota bacterium]MBL7011352.1 hypothetical protein [Kiritimatiellales bacterium]